MRLTGIIFVLLSLHFNTYSQQDQGYAIINATLISMESELPATGKTVLMENGKISRIEDSGKIKIPKKFKVIDGTGKYMIPGFFDMHTHFFYEQGTNVNTCEEELK